LFPESKLFLTQVSISGALNNKLNITRFHYRGQQDNYVVYINIGPAGVRTSLPSNSLKINNFPCFEKHFKGFRGRGHKPTLNSASRTPNNNKNSEVEN
jgi:hypothetical protein